MSEPAAISHPELGRYLTRVRERAGLKQAELARRITWSPAVLSRIETGERPLASEELETLLDAIATPEAVELRQVLQRDWRILPRPPLDHPDQALLWSAEQAAQDLARHRDRPDVRNAFERRLGAYITEIERTAAFLLKREHQIAFIGSIGIGKSTAICRLTGLEIPADEGTLPVPVLEAGAGGITICEVHLRTGPAYGLIIEPRSDDDIRNDVTDFAEHLLRIESAGHDTAATDGDADSQGISKEIERAIRNMSGLKVRREKTERGKTHRRDEARELAKKLGTVRELVVDVLARMEMHKRDRRDIWYSSNCGKSHHTWLKETFEEINNGRHPEFTLPKRIEVVVPTALLDGSDVAIRLIDTRGIDRTAARADLEVHLDDPHTTAVLCSGFNNAPAAEARLLLERARALGVRELDNRAALLVLPHPTQALAMKDESGIRVATAEEGYELKEEQVLLALEPLGVRDFAVGFFNACQDDPARLRGFVLERISRSRDAFRTRLRETIDSARSLLANHEHEQTQEVIRHAATMLRSWAARSAAVELPSVHVHDSLMDQLGISYASTIRATVRREGEWPNLSYSHHLGYGARRIAALALGGRVDGFSEVCGTMLSNPEFTEAQDLIEQAQRVLLSGYEDLLRKVQLMGQTSFRDSLRLDGELWNQCMGEWGQGPGYRDRVAERNSAWFGAEPRRQLERELQALIEREWSDALENLTSLFDVAP